MMLACLLGLPGGAPWSLGAAETTEAPWRPLSLISDGHVDPAWCHVGWGGFTVDNDALRTECDPRGLGLLVYQKERFGNCQIRVVYRAKDPKSNAGVFVRIGDGILEQTNTPGAAFEREARGRISKPSMTNMIASAERFEGPWFAVHRGFEVQIMDDNDALHRTGAIYSLAASSAPGKRLSGEWRTMIITLDGNRILVDLDDRRVTTFDPESLPPQHDRKWTEPDLQYKRPVYGYIGLQNHDPGNLVWFKEISVRPMNR